MRDYTKQGERVTTPWGAGVIDYRTEGYAGETDLFMVTLDAPLSDGVTVVGAQPSEVQPEPKRRVAIVFESTECGRCSGTGRFSYNQVDGTRCYGCRGAGRKFTRRGIAARKAYDALVAERRMTRAEAMREIARRYSGATLA